MKVNSEFKLKDQFLTLIYKESLFMGALIKPFLNGSSVQK